MLVKLFLVPIPESLRKYGRQEKDILKSKQYVLIRITQKFIIQKLGNYCNLRGWIYLWKDGVSAKIPILSL